VVKKKAEDKGIKPAATVDGREQQLISLAVNLAEKQLRDGTASPSIINHYLKMASTRESIEREMLKKQSKLIDAKVQSIVEGKEQEQLAKAAIEAMKNYNSSSN
jgi:hypothetical protein